MIKCVDCGKEIPEDHIVYCDMCGAPLCEECGNLGLCLTCAELWEAEIDLEDMEAAEEGF
jgi:predicted amidophosphoribosyltransferase